MQSTTNSDARSTVGSGTTTGTNDAIEAIYVGRHRPYRMSLRHPRVRVSRLAGRNSAESK